MRFGRCEWILKKNDREDFIGFLIENVIMKVGFSPNNPHFNCVCFFDDIGEENTCSESDFILTACKMHKIIDINLWKEYESIEILFDRTYENYDIFELNINLLDGEECYELINSITALVLNNNLDLKGIIFDKCGVLHELSFNYTDDWNVNFAFNEKSDIRNQIMQFYKYSFHICDEFNFPVLNNNNIKNIYTFIFLFDKKIKVDTFELKTQNN